MDFAWHSPSPPHLRPREWIRHPRSELRLFPLLVNDEKGITWSDVDRVPVPDPSNNVSYTLIAHMVSGEFKKQMGAFRALCLAANAKKSSWHDPGNKDLGIHADLKTMIHEEFQKNHEFKPLLDAFEFHQLGIGGMLFARRYLDVKYAAITVVEEEEGANAQEEEVKVKGVRLREDILREMKQAEGDSHRLHTSGTSYYRQADRAIRSPGQLAESGGLQAAGSGMPLAVLRRATSGPPE